MFWLFGLQIFSLTSVWWCVLSKCNISDDYNHIRLILTYEFRKKFVRAKVPCYVILFHVLLYNNPLYSWCAENLWHHLKRMGLFENDEIHPVLGNIKQALETLVQQRLELCDRVDCKFIVLLLWQLIALDRHYVLISGHVFSFRYLQKDKVSGPEGNTLFYELAERALDGPVIEKIKEYISQVLIEDFKVNDWLYFLWCFWVYASTFFCI